jgi:hypothetical protein
MTSVSQKAMLLMQATSKIAISKDRPTLKVWSTQPYTEYRPSETKIAYTNLLEPFVATSPSRKSKQSHDRLQVAILNSNRPENIYILPLTKKEE